MQDSSYSNFTIGKSILLSLTYFSNLCTKQVSKNYLDLKKFFTSHIDLCTLFSMTDKTISVRKTIRGLKIFRALTLLPTVR